MAEKFAEIIDFGGNVGERTLRDKYARADINVLIEALTKTASGNPVVITDCAGGKARSLITTINAVQDLHGYDKPWVGGAGKNKLPMVLSDIKTVNTQGTWSGNVYTIYGVVVTVLTDSADNVIGFNLNGVCTANFSFYVTALEIDLEANGMTYSGLTTGSDATYFLYWDGAGVQVDTGEVTITTGRNPIRMGRIVVRENANLSNVKVYPMVRLSTESDASFAPYKNECPISGRTAVAVDDTGRNIWDEQWEVGMISSDNGQNVAANDTIRSKNYIPVTPSTNFYIRCLQGVVMLFYAGDKSYITYQNLNNGGAFTTPQNAKYIRFRTYVAYGTTYHNDICINISDASFNGQYVPYAHSSDTIQLGTTVYGADINWDTGVATVTDAIVDISTLDYTPSSPENHVFRTDSIRELIFLTTDGYTPADAISSAYKTMAWKPLSAANDGCFAVANYGANVYGRTVFVDHRSSTVAEFIFNNSGQTVCYKLKQPTTIQLTRTQLELLKGYNRVTIDNGSIELGYIGKIA